MKKKVSSTDQEIDEQVIMEAKDDSAWEEPILVQRDDFASLTMPSELAKRAAFLARLHHESNTEAWLTRVIRERVELEEGAFLLAKREMSFS